MNRTFGLKEAEAASQYTRTEGERRSVLGVLGVLGIKNTVAKEAETACTKNAKKVEVLETKIVKLKTRQAKFEDEVDVRNEVVEDICETVKDWVL